MSKGNESSLGRIDPPAGGLAITPGSDMDLTIYTLPARGVYVAVTGNLKVDLAGPEAALAGTGGTGITYSNLNAGQDYPRFITKIYAATTIQGVVHF